MPYLEDYHSDIQRFGLRTKKNVRFEGDFDAPLKNRTVNTVGVEKADYTYSASMSGKHYADAVNSALGVNSEVFLRGEVVNFTQSTGKVVTPLNNTVIRGAGIDSTIINTSRRDYIFKNTVNNVSNITLSDMTIDCGNLASVSGINISKYSGLRLSRLKFKNSIVWFVKSANEPAQSTSDINTDFIVEDSVFDTHNGILEMLLIFNTNRVDINRSLFTNKTGSAGSAPTLGFWQKINDARVRNSRFENLVGYAIYYGFTANHILVENCDFINVQKGLHGAIVSDYGKFGTKFVSNIEIRGSYFIGGTNSTQSEAIQIGAVHDFVVSDNYIEGHAKGIRIGFGNNVPSASDGGDASFPSVRGRIQGITFKDINPLGTNKTLNSPIFFGNGGDFKSLIVDNVTVQDDNNYLDYAVIFNGGVMATATVNSNIVTAVTATNNFAWYDTAPTVSITGGGGNGATATATIDSDGRVTGFTVTNGGSGYTTTPTASVQGAKYKNIVFRDCDFGGKKILINDSSQLDTATIRFIDCRNFNTSNLTQSFIDSCVVSTGGYVSKRLTTTERDALSPLNGMTIYNTTLDKFQGYQAGAWVNFA